jgi:RHS repeat-associated protein
MPLVAAAESVTIAYDGQDILRQTTGAAVRTYIHGPGIDEPLAHEEGSATTYYHADALGSIVRLTDGTGNVVVSRQYDAWGNLEAGATTAGFAFTGREWDPEIGLYYYRARYYDAKAGRFISEDPIGFAGGKNFYDYATANPARFVDPFGYSSVDDTIRTGSPQQLRALLNLEGTTPQQQAAVRAALKRWETPVRDLIRGRLKSSSSYRSELEHKTLEEITALARTNKDAAKMLKLIRNEKRLMEKLGAWIAAACGFEEDEDEEPTGESSETPEATDN